MSSSYAAFHSAAEIPDRDVDYPDVKVLWEKSHTARNTYLCAVCGDEIAPGTRHHSSGWIIDGEFRTEKTHGAPRDYPSRCPRFAERDYREITGQFEADRALFS